MNEPMGFLKSHRFYRVNANKKRFLFYLTKIVVFPRLYLTILAILFTSFLILSKTTNLTLSIPQYKHSINSVSLDIFS
jgi:hypothetical protein